MKFFGEKGFLWDFGDGTTDSINKFRGHVYTTPGTYLVKLTAFGTECSFTDIDSVNIIDDNLLWHLPPFDRISVNMIMSVLTLPIITL